MLAEKKAADLGAYNAHLLNEIAEKKASEERKLNDAARRKKYFEENDLKDTENQMKFINQCELYAVRPVNTEAVQVLYALDEWIHIYEPTWRLSFEVSMGAFIKTSNEYEDRLRDAAFSSYNSKRVDFLLIDRFGKPQLAVEYHGTGHDLSDDAADRMAVKRLALQKAGIPLIEISANTPKTDILRMASELLGSRAASL
ncbi:DUF2726 domain-containing protein [Acidocella sp.]|uniref:DUF2726 domain-containing protein n=1 Tax=Acidocella sp. TaxID=50710 RepID=UPI0026249678|nr:DUF2726 domain-containing protein [Acidocella sp.]